MVFLSKRLLVVITLFLFCLLGTLVWTLIGNAYIKFLPGVRKITVKDFLVQLFMFYLFALFICFLFINYYTHQGKGVFK
jgi:hypothetical protein